MAEQERIQKRKLRQKRSQSDASEIQPATSDSRHEDIEKKLSEVDAAFDDYLMATSQPAVDSVAVNQQRPHRVVRPLSDETLVRGFHQTSGE